MSRDLKVVVISDSALPDARVERSALFYSEIIGAETFLIAPGTPVIVNTIVRGLGRSIKLDFITLRNVNKFSRLGVPYYYNLLKRYIGRILRDIDPDFVHVHNIFVGKVVSDVGYNFVLDDHELYSVQVRARTEKSGFLNKYKSLIKSGVWKRLERKLARRARLVITVSRAISNYYREEYGAERVITIPNFPISYELEAASRVGVNEDIGRWVEGFEDHLRVVYIGRDAVESTMPYREMKYVISIIRGFEDRIVFYILGTREKMRIADNILALGYLPHMSLYGVLDYMDVGLCTWLPHRLHSYFNPNKVFLYPHAGLVPVVTSTLIDVINYLDNIVIKVHDPRRELGEILLKLSNAMDEIRLNKNKIMEFARERLILDKYLNKIKTFLDSL